MELKNVVLYVYSTSKSEDLKSVSGDFIINNIKRNNRTQLVHKDADIIYWISNDSLEEMLKQQSTTVSFSVGKEMQIQAVEHTKYEFPTYYTVSRGDTITTIANKFDTSEVHINALNGSDKFVIGQKIRVK